MRCTFDIIQGGSKGNKRGNKCSSPDGSEFGESYVPLAARSAPPSVAVGTATARLMNDETNIFRNAFPVLEGSQDDVRSSNQHLAPSNPNLYEKVLGQLCLINRLFTVCLDR